MKVNKVWNRIKYGSNLDKPGYMVRLFKNLCLRYLFNRRPLRGIDFAVDYACDLRCKHCFNKDVMQGERKMQLKDYARVFKEAEMEGILNFCFQGGEFLLLGDWEEYIKLVDPKRFSISVTTNGTHLTPTVARRFKELGVNTVTISIDSGIAEEHDTFRGVPGTFKKALQAIDFSMAEGLKVVINSTISPQNLRSKGFIELIELTCRKGLLLNTIFAAPSGKWIGCEKVVMKDSDISEYNTISRKYGNIVRDMDSLYLGRGCPGVTESIYISPYGDVFGCAYIHIRLGNVFEESLSNIRQKGFMYFNYPKKCLISENLDFIREYNRVAAGKVLPLPFEAHEEIKAWP